MRPWIKLLLVGIVGFGGGFASGFFVHKKMNDVQFQEITEEEMDEIEKKESETAPAKKVMKEIPFVPPVHLPDDDPDQLRLILQGKKSFIEADAETKRAYEKMWKATKDYSSEENANKIPTIPVEENEEEDDPDISELEREADDAENYNIPDPYMISLPEFYNGGPEYDKITIDWYMEDDVWMDEREQPIPDISTYIGMDAKNLFNIGTSDDDPDIRFVRNERYQSDYEIVRHHRSYSDTVRGVD